MRLLVIDGNSIANRAFFGIKLLTTKDGRYTNAIFGFLNILLSLLKECGPDEVAVAFDLKAPTFRHKMYDGYKATRHKMPDELAAQMPVLKELLAALGYREVTAEGWEADDILGTLSAACAARSDDCFLATGDRDSLQLVDDATTVLLATNRETLPMDPAAIQEKYGVAPPQLIEVKSLMGDASDNIPGVPGIGEKTALSLIKQEGDVKTLYEHLADIKLTPSVRTKLENGHQDAIDSRFLAEICLEAPVDKATEFYKLGEVDTEKTKALLADLEMMRLIDRLGLSGKAVESADSAVQESKLKLSDLPKFEVKPLDESVISVLGKDKTVYFIFADNKLSILCNDVIYTTEDNAIITAFMGTACEKITFEGKTAHKFAFSNGTHLENLTFCCDLAGYLLNSQSSEYTAENLCLSYKCLYRSDMGEYADLSSLPALSENLKKQLEMTEMTKLFDDIEMPLCEVLASMEFYGVKADAEGIKAFGEDLKIKIDELTSQIYMYAGKEFNIASTKQLGDVLFEDLGLPAKKKTKSGYSTNADVLESLMDKHPIVPLIVEYRTLTKLNSTYVDGLLKLIHPDGRVHSVFKQTETRTGRISSTEPNMQNIPVRKEIGRNMRKFFVAEDGYTLLDADYSQIELRVLASVCGDKNMQEAFSEGRDIHTSTAAQVFDIPEDFVTPEMRSAAKAVNFGIIYGIGAFSLSKDINVSVYEAKKYIDDYLHNFPNVEKFMNDTVENAKKNGYVTTMFGRKRYVPELSASNKNMQAAGRRIAMNTPIQGSAADIIKIAMVRVYRRLKEEVPDARLILQVHDELIVECDVKDAEAAGKILSEEMTNACELKVPLTADVNRGDSWYEAKG